MGVYIGYIEKKGNEPTIWLNFKPIARITDSRVVQLSQEEQEVLLPDSEKRNISFAFSWNNNAERKKVDEIIYDKVLVVFDFTIDDLQPNIKATGERNQTGYKVSAVEMIEASKIRPIESIGIYYAIPSSEVISNFGNDAIVELNNPNIHAGDKVFVETDGFWAGPFEVGFREYTSSYYVKPQIKENKYTVMGYKKGSVAIQELTSYDGYWGTFDNSWGILLPNKDATLEQFDMITDEALLESFKDSFHDKGTNGRKFDFDDIPALLKRYEESVVAGADVTEHLRKKRLNRLVDILTSESDLDETLGTITDFICDLLIQHQDSANVEEWLQALLDKHPELIEGLKGTQSISVRIAQLEQNLTDLQQEKAEIESEIADKKAEAEDVDRQAVEEKKKELLEMDSEYTKLCEKLESTKVMLGIVGQISELGKKQSEVQSEVDYLENHKNHLVNDTKELELGFQELISQQYKRMVSITFDGFMASKMLHAAAEWEVNDANRKHNEMVDRINGIEISSKNPSELIDYLCKTIQKVRPSYSKNVIVNIAICITQGFLTVFSGEPGCGKTSICNIFGATLGLNKFSEIANLSDEANRYVPVSVERGWTSKRDFVGYYNPLSKTFDKSNRRVYEALHQLDTEKRNCVYKFPYLVLLDEANLSPMEYYWSDFMNICDDLSDQSNVNLGENYIFGIPETLHFMATINNDHTTENLSPRLVDRAWIVTLPQQSNLTIGVDELSNENLEIISWKSLKNAFIPSKEECQLSDNAKRIYDSIIIKLREGRFIVSPRVEKAIKQYWAVASKYFDMDETKTAAGIVALDYAIAQRILPKIIGNGEQFEKWLDEFRELCSKNELNMSATILKDITDRGNQQMKYYQFF